MNFKVIILGSSSALPTSIRFPSAHLLNANERFYLIDCGEGTQVQLRRFSLPFSKINHIFISHLHGDHVFGIFGIISSYELLGRKIPLNIYAPAGFETFIDFYTRHFGHSIIYPLNFHVIPEEGGIIFEDKNIHVTALPLTHKIPTFGFLFKENKRLRNLKKDVVKKFNIPIKEVQGIKEGNDYYDTENSTKIKNSSLTLPPYKSRSYAYITDTIVKPSLAGRIENVDILYHEATFLHKDLARARETCHSTSKQAAELAKNAHAKKLLIGHFSARYKSTEMLLEEAKSIFENTVSVNDGDIFEVLLERE